MSEKEPTMKKEVHTQIIEEKEKRSFKNILVVICCLLSSILFSYILNNPVGNYIPILFIATFEWYRSYPQGKHSYYGLCRLLFYLFVITLWNVLLLKFLIEGIAYLIGYHHISIRRIEHLFPYALMFTSFARTKSDMSLHDKRRYMIHLLYDVPALIVVLIFKLLNDPLNSLYSEITSYCYLGCLPMPSDVKILNDIGIKYVINMCAEYNGPRKTYEKYEIIQLHLPTIDSTAPSIKTIEKAMKFMNDAYINKQKIFVHCKSGMARSASIVLCHLVANEKMSPEDALKLLKEKRAEVSSSIITFSSIKHFLAALKKE